MKTFQLTLETSKKAFSPVKTFFGRTFQRYGDINGEQCAASFAYYAFFSLFPLILLLVAVGTFFVRNRQEAAMQVVQQVQAYMPLQQKDKAVIVSTVDGIIKNGLSAGIFGVLALTWSSLRFFQALVIGVNRSWGFRDYGWWGLPLRNLMMIGILSSALLLGIVAPLLIDKIRDLLNLDAQLASFMGHYVDLFFAAVTGLIPTLILFYGVLMFYKFAPRRPAKIRRIWPAALFVTLFLKFGQSLFSWYLGAFANFNALYGVFGTIMALMFWIYVSGAIVVLGACAAAATSPTGQTEHNITGTPASKPS
ncbi:MAG: YihY/virulence factor BrkB family protein [Verrucomicrobia bacterium]|nr:YihY/virulence factor BrkB family protein [Verrucomicrobiota bacterium]MBV9673933.1 YihY/virulence factor BrkB family protein [Verrucomicrobiota bacterium]